MSSEAINAPPLTIAAHAPARTNRESPSEDSASGETGILCCCVCCVVILYSFSLSLASGCLSRQHRRGPFRRTFVYLHRLRQAAALWVPEAPSAYRVSQPLPAFCVYATDAQARPR